MIQTRHSRKAPEFYVLRGIGAGIALDLAERGANVIVTFTSDRRAVEGAEVVKAIEATGSKASLIKANVAILSDLKKLVDAALALSESRKIDILVHNAATGDDCFLEDMSEKFYQSQIDVHLKGHNPWSTIISRS